jgi:exosome complex component RRP42
VFQKDPDPTMAEVLLSEEEKYYLVIGVEEDKRVDGRSRLDYRSGDLEINCVSNSHGSLRIRLAESDVIISAKVDIGEPLEETPGCGQITFLVDCSPTASPAFEGRGGDELSETICRILQSAYVKSGALDLSSLCIVNEKCCYVIGVDILVLQCGGNLLDVISMGVKLCLGICEIPVIEEVRYDLGYPTPAFTTDEFKFNYLDVGQSPVVITLPRIGRYFVVDATLEEESCSKGKLAIAVTPNGIITNVDKLGKGCYQSRSISASVQMAAKVGISLNKVLDSKIDILRKSKPRKSNPAAGGSGAPIKGEEMDET